ncbi:MAG TPA: 3-oxoacyl-ACP reductase family protein [Planctomycetota bacterium]|nr:3-oxoacyl-ACP reductase family protein [Planctomycetota bacterium]
MSQKNVLELFKLNGRRALVTGGSKGLGKVMATALAQAGADVAVSSRHLDEAQAAAAEIAKETGRASYAVAADVSVGAEVERMAAELERRFGPIDILFNNAGINIRGNIADFKEADWDSVIAINLKGPFLCAKAFAPAMAKRGWGRIINMGSIMSVVALPGRAPYAASKAGVLNMTRVMALEWATQGVTANAICPGPFATEMNVALLSNPDAYKAFVSKLPIGRWGELHEIAGIAVFLASDASSFVTGTGIYVDGGWTAQ